jgi:D-glycerate 3-kinase
VGAWGDVGVRATTVSIDDFYLTYDEQRALADRHPGNDYLRYRGYPGTHDVALGSRVLDALAALGPGEETRMPQYLKSAHEGRGDRAPASAWKRAVGPLDVVVFEGWMLGFVPVDPAGIDDAMRPSNAMLAAYAEWNRRLDAFVRLDVSSLERIVDWRVDAERGRREAGEVALNDEDARDYIERFLPAYRVYLPGLRARPPCDELSAVVLGADRMPLRGP